MFVNQSPDLLDPARGDGLAVVDEDDSVRQPLNLEEDVAAHHGSYPPLGEASDNPYHVSPADRIRTVQRLVQYEQFGVMS